MCVMLLLRERGERRVIRCPLESPEDELRWRLGRDVAVEFDCDLWVGSEPLSLSTEASEGGEGTRDIVPRLRNITASMVIVLPNYD